MDLAVQIAQLVVAFGVIAAVLAIRQAQRQRIRAFDDFYARRYWQLKDQLSLNAIRGRALLLSAQDKKTIRAYLALCEDELDLRAGGWISDATWEIWQASIAEQLRSNVVRPVWGQVRGEAERGIGQPFARLRSFEAVPADPIGLGWVRRRWRGLHGVLWW